MPCKGSKRSRSRRCLDTGWQGQHWPVMSSPPFRPYLRQGGACLELPVLLVAHARGVLCTLQRDGRMPGLHQRRVQAGRVELHHEAPGGWVPADQRAHRHAGHEVSVRQM